jgi:hypothetical protein
MTALMTTQMTMSTCIQIQNGLIRAECRRALTNPG